MSIFLTKFYEKMRKILPLLLALVLSTVCFGQITSKNVLTNKKSSDVLLKSGSNSRDISDLQQYREVDALTKLTYFDEGSFITFVGLGEGAPITANAMIYIPASTVELYKGQQVRKFVFYVNAEGDGTVNALKLRIWTDTANINNPAYEQEVTDVIDGWNEVELNTPYTLGAEPIFFGYLISGVGGVMGMEKGIDNLEPNGYGDLLKINGETLHAGKSGIGDLAFKAYVGDPDSIDVKLESIDVEYRVVPEMIDIVGTVKNTGIDTINSYDVTYILNGDTSSIYSVAGVNIVAGATHQFTHDIKADLTEVGFYDLKIVISNVNNSNEESNLEDNVLSKNINCVLELIQKKVLHEVFASSSCGGCAIYDHFVDEVINKNLDKTTLIKYQVNWPAPGDPYHTEEVEERVSYYGVIASPSLLADGQFRDVVYRQKYLDVSASAPAFLKIDNGLLNYDFDTKNLTANLDIIGLSNVSGNLVAQMAVVEKKTTGNVTTNGETEFYNVMMKFMNSTNGNPLSNFAARDTQHLSVTTNLDSTYIEEISDIRVVVWVQDNNTKEVLQSEYIDLTQEDMIDVAIEKLETVNTACGGLPSDGEIKIIVANKGIVDVSNFDVNYLLNGEQVQKYTYEDTLVPGEQAQIVFTQDFSQTGNYDIVVTTDLEGDIVEANSEVEKVVHNLTPVAAEGYAENFQTLPIGWIIEDANEDGKSWMYLNYIFNDQEQGHDDISAFVYQYNNDMKTGGDDYLYSRCIDFEASKTYELSFWCKSMTEQYPEKLNVFIGDAPNKGAMIQQIVDLGILYNDVYENSKTRFQVPADGTYYIGFHAYSDPDKWLLFVDDIKISDVTAVNEIVDDVNIYPNPTNGLFRVEGVQGAKVVVYNIVGEVVYRNSNASENININLSSQKAGSYLVKITNNDDVSIHKITVTK